MRLHSDQFGLDLCHIRLYRTHIRLQSFHMLKEQFVRYIVSHKSALFSQLDFCYIEPDCKPKRKNGSIPVRGEMTP